MRSDCAKWRKLEPGEMVKRLSSFIRAEGRFKKRSHRKFPEDARRCLARDLVIRFALSTMVPACAGARWCFGVIPVRTRSIPSRRNEFMVIRAAFEGGVPVPEVFWLSDDPSVLGAAFFIMERVEGETLARRLLRDDTYANAREVIPSQLAEILAKIHRIDPAQHKLDFPATGRRRCRIRRSEALRRKLPSARVGTASSV